MNEEIEKILDRLERIDHKEYSCSFEFADSGSFKETCMCFDERKKLANYIKDLQQENKQLKDNWNKLKEHLENEIKEWKCVDDDWTKAQVQEDRVILNKMQELENGDSNDK